jgi:hypothetical protein
MQFTRQAQQQPQQLMTCPQCDNVVPIGAPFCNICGTRLYPPPTTAQASAAAAAAGAAATATATPAQPGATPTAPAPPASYDEEEDEEEEDYEYEEGEEEEEGESGKATQTAAPPLAPGEIHSLLQRLEEQVGQIDVYFPANLPDKAQKINAWKKQLQRASACARLLERPQIQQIESQQALRLRHHIAEAARALDYTREYTVKLVGHAGAGKSTLLAALIGRDIFPRLAGGAVTGVRTRVRLCRDDEPEEMHVHFLTRAAFGHLLSQTQQAIKTAPTQKMREALAAELTILLKASEAFGDTYLKDDQPYVEIVPRERWKTESRRYIEEPARDSEEPRLTRVIDYVEYRVHAGPRSVLPPNSVLVDLPGGAAGQIYHDLMLREELKQVDALLLVIGNNRFGDDERIQRIFEEVRQAVLQNRAFDVASRMLFLVVTHWDEINSPASQEKALGSLRPFLRELPPGYASYHRHGSRHTYFFYPLRALDALLATLGLAGTSLDEERQQEGREYAGRLLGIYPELLKVAPSLPPTTSAQEFEQVTREQHEAMLQYSGLPELTHDLQVFLTENRYEVQLRHAETQLAMALQLTEDLCWEQMSQLGVESHDLQELQQEMRSRQARRSAARFEHLQRRTNAMLDAWNDALRQFDSAISSEKSVFQRVLQTAHERAAQRVKIRITQGHFDHYIKVGNRRPEDSPAMEIGNRWTDIDGWGLIKALRQSLCMALERELNDPARTLAEAFLMPIAYKEEVDGSLDINRVALGEFGGELDEIQKAYNKLKRSIREKARDICLYVTLGELLNEEKYAPTRENPAVGALYRLTNAQGRAEEIIQQARRLMAPILDTICNGLARSTEQRIARLFRYELDKLQERQVYDSDRLEAQPVSQNGTFSDIVTRLYSHLTERVHTSEALRQQLDNLQAQREAALDQWVDLLQEVEALKTIHRQE